MPQPIGMCLETWKLNHPMFSYKRALRACLEVLAGERSHLYTLDQGAVLPHQGKWSSLTKPRVQLGEGGL